MNKKLIAAVLTLTAPVLNAAPIPMTGDYVKTAVSDDGTLGMGGTSSPGLLHDATGTGTFGVDDYLTPGTPYEGFTVSSTESGNRSNNNSSYFPDTTFGDDILGSITDISGASVYDFAVNFSGSVGGFFDISTDTFFNDGDERIGMTTTITALDDLTNVTFARYIDPDPDVNTFGSFSTDNDRGNIGLGLAPEDWVRSVGTSTGLTLGLYSDSSVTHNTSVIGSSGGGGTWSDDPADYLAGVNDGDGDYSIGIGFDIGSLSTGDSSSFTYYYVMGDTVDTVDIPDPLPTPATLALFGLGVFALGLVRRRKV